MAVSSYRSFPPPTRVVAVGESNFVDTAVSFIEFNNGGNIRLMATIPQGTSVNQRIGKRAYYRSVTLRGAIFSGPSVSLNDNSMLIIYDKRPNGVLPAVTDILTATTPNGFMNDNNSGRFEVIRRIDIATAGSSTAPTGTSIINLDHYIPMKSRPIVFESGAGGAISDIDSGALYLLCTSSTSSGALCSSANISYRIRFSENP